jgi:Holliday junction resolvase RusA-like endonuclease
MSATKNPAAANCGAPKKDLAGASINSDFNTGRQTFQPCLEPVTITLAGPPQGKGRARAYARGPYVRLVTPEKTRSYEGMIRTAAMDALGDRPPIDAPVAFALTAVFPVPASWPERKRKQALNGEIQPGKKPDLDNIAKAWNDALNGVVYRDDSLICTMTLAKRYGLAPLVSVIVKPMGAKHGLT